MWRAVAAAVGGIGLTAAAIVGVVTITDDGNPDVVALPAGAEPVPTSTSVVTAAPLTDSAAETEIAAVPGVFLATFDGAPPAPAPFDDPGWDVTVHSRSVDTFEVLEPVQAAHGPDCSAPPDSHEITAYDDMVYRCRDHMMTALNASDYGMIYLTPDHLVDFRDGTATIAFDVSTARTSVRDWWDVWITPYDDHLQLPLDLGTDVDAAGPPRRSLHVTLGTENQMHATIYDEFEPVTFDGWPEDNVPGDPFTGYETFLDPDPARRDRFEIQLSADHLRVGMPDYDFWWIDTDIPPLDWSAGVVQFGHHSYNPTKDCHVVNNPTPPVDDCLPNTWHWDNVSIDPSVPFTIVGASPRSVDEAVPTVTLDVPAPADARLRFAGIGDGLEVRFDDGPWEPAVAQATQQPTKDEHFAGYWQPIPAGTTTVSFRSDDWWGGPWHVRDVSVWAPPT